MTINIIPWWDVMPSSAAAFHDDKCASLTRMMVVPLYNIMLKD